MESQLDSAPRVGPPPSPPRPTSAVRAAAPGKEVPVTIIRPGSGWQAVDFRELWRARELAYVLAWRDVKVRYKQTLLGVAWAVLQPLMMMGVFTVFFSRMAKVPAGDLPYPLFAFAGLLPWMLFAAALTGASASVLASERLITKIYFPRLLVPLAAIGTPAVDFAVGWGLLLVLSLGYGVLPGPGLLLAPAIMATILALAMGLGTILAGMAVTYRDVKHVIPFLVQFGLFATPTIYMQPPALGWLAALNPMVPLVAAFRASVLGTPIPWAPLGLAAATTVLVLTAGCFYFRRVEDSFADVI